MDKIKVASGFENAKSAESYFKKTFDVDGNKISLKFLDYFK